MSDAVTWHPGVILGPEQLTPELIAAIKEALTPSQTLALTAWGEARSRLVKGAWYSNRFEAMLDVMNVIDNRAKDPRWAAKGHKGVCLQPWQFSCWEPTGGPDDKRDPDHLAENFEALIDRAQRVLAGQWPSDKLLNCLAGAQAVCDGVLTDTLFGATHYHSDWLKPYPAWAFHDPKSRRMPRKPVCERHGHLFYSGVF